MFHPKKKIEAGKNFFMLSPKMVLLGKTLTTNIL